MNKYWGYGLTIHSEIEFSELLPFDFEGNPDITIGYGDIPDSIEGNDVFRKYNVTITSKEYILKLDNVATYYVANGDKIVVAPSSNGDEDSIRLFLLSNAFAALLHQRDCFMLHASAVNYDGGVVLFCGKSGIGKSTTAKSMEKKGYSLFSDDVCVLHKNTLTGGIEVIPSYPMLKLWEDSFEKIGVVDNIKSLKLRPGLPKFGCFFHADFDIAPKPIRHIFILDKQNFSNISIVKSSLVDAFEKLQQNSYRPLQIDAMNKRASIFTLFSKVVSTIPVWEVFRPQSGNSLAELVEEIERVLSVK